MKADVLVNNLPIKSLSIGEQPFKTAGHPAPMSAVQFYGVPVDSAPVTAYCC